MKDLSLHLLDIIQNSITAGATKIDIIISADKASDELIIKVKDNGIGMDEELLSRVSNPFITTRTTRTVGLGIPLFQASAQRAGGKLIISSTKGIGTTINACFKISHIDRLPLGRVSETIGSVIMAGPHIDVDLVLDNSVERFEFSTIDIKKKLDGVSINEYSVLTWIGDYIDEGVKRIFGGVLDEITG